MRTKWCASSPAAGWRRLSGLAVAALERSVALKQLDLRSDDPNARPALHPRVAHAASFDHPNIVTVFDFFEYDGVPFIAMEYLAARVAAAARRRLSQRRCSASCSGCSPVWRTRRSTASPSRPQAREPADHPRRRDQDRRLRDRQGLPRDDGAALGDRRSRSGRRPTWRPSRRWRSRSARHRPVRGRDDRLRDAERRSAVRERRHPDGAAVQARQRAAAAAHRPGSADRRLGRATAGEEPAARPPDAKEAWRELEPTIVDLLGPFWRNDATLGEVPRDEYVTMVHDREVGLATPGRNRPRPSRGARPTSARPHARRRVRHRHRRNSLRRDAGLRRRRR